MSYLYNIQTVLTLSNSSTFLGSYNENAYSIEYHDCFK